MIPILLREMQDQEIKMKMELTIKRINTAIRAREVDTVFWNEKKNIMISPLDLVFERDELGDYGRIIREEAIIYVGSKLNNPECLWSYRYRGVCRGDARMDSAIMDFVKCCKDWHFLKEGYKLFFWSLMVIVLDDINSDEKLSCICDLASMLKIRDDILTDIMMVINRIFDDSSENKYKNSEISIIFDSIFNSSYVLGLLK